MALAYQRSEPIIEAALPPSPTLPTLSWGHGETGQQGSGGTPKEAFLSRTTYVLPGEPRGGFATRASG